MSSRTFNLAFSTVSLAALSLSALAPAAHAQFGNNLIVNGNAESGSSSSTGNTVVAIPGWTNSGGATVVAYNATGFPSTSSPGPADRGSQFFAGGPDTAASTLTQNISLSFASGVIDAGSATYALSGYLGGFDNQNDNASLTVTFLNASAQSVGTATIGPVSSVDRNNVTGLLLRTTSGTVPIGARTATAVLSFTRSSGAFNDGYADNLGFAVNSSVTAPEPGSIALLLSASIPVIGLIRRRKRA